MTTEQIAATLLEIADFLKSQPQPLKPEPAFILPPCAPDIEWHRPDGWKLEDLPQGWRPLTHGEIVQKNDEVKNGNLDDNCFIAALGSIGWEVGYTHKNQYCRTRRPLIFTHAGKQWTWHRPGDPMPCDGEREVQVILVGGKSGLGHTKKGDVWLWNESGGDSIIGWRYADETKTVPLGPENVPPGSVFRGAGEAKDSSDKGWCLITSCSKTGIRYWRNSDRDPVELTWESLRSLDSQINRSIPLTGRWDPSAWEPCHKPA